MIGMRQLGALAVAAALTAGTAHAAGNAIKEFDAEIIWQGQVQGKTATVSGTLKNVRYTMMYDLELTVTALDAKGKEIGEQRELLIPVSLPLNDAARFSVNVPLKEGAKPEKLRFLYRYRATEGNSESTYDLRSVTTLFASPAPVTRP